MVGHSRNSPSAAIRWRNCPAAPRMEADLPDEAGVEAAIGTVFHEYAALCLELGLDPYIFVGAPCDTDHGTLYFDRPMADNMLYGLDYVRDLAADGDTDLHVEQWVDCSPWLGHNDDGSPQGGTADVVVINRSKKKITVFDWKYGAGVPVSAEWNDQAIIYFLGVWHKFSDKYFENVPPAEIDVDLVIEQPRAPGGGGVWRTNAAALLAEGEKIKADAEATFDPNAPAVPGVRQCQFCRAAKYNTCKARAEFNLEKFDLSLSEIDDLAEMGASVPLPETRALTPEQRSYILLNRSMLTRWLDQLHAEAYDDALKGRPVPEMKLVLGRSPARRWKDEEKEKVILERRFGIEGAYTRKLISPTQAEDIVGKKVFAERFASHVAPTEPKPELVPITDRRDPIPDVQSRFDSLMDDDLI